MAGIPACQIVVSLKLEMRQRFLKILREMGQGVAGGGDFLCGRGLLLRCRRNAPHLTGNLLPLLIDLGNAARDALRAFRNGADALGDVRDLVGDAHHIAKMQTTRACFGLTLMVP